MKPLALLLLAATALPARACVNDRDSDSLATQARQLPETLRVITGRFERNPPLFYQMRIRRSLDELKTAPRQFGLYDDIGAAYDKLGRDDQALQTMARKRALLPAFNAKNSANKEAWYRYFANAGTFRAHRFLRAGAPSQKLGETKTARAQIKRALQIKPNAHFGREKYQLMAMDWIIARKSKRTKDTLGQWIARGDKWKPIGRDTTLANSGRKRAVEGLSGLIVLGGAWESPDVFEALGAALETRDSVTLRYIAFLRAQELLDKNKPSWAESKQISEALNPNGSALFDYRYAVNAINASNLEELFFRCRTEAEGWNALRQEWMTAKLKRGLHPDTNSNFWESYGESEPPSLDIQWYNWSEEVGQSNRQSIAVVCLGGALLCASILLLKRAKRRRLAL